MKISKDYEEYVKKTLNKAYTVEMAACALIEEVVELGDSSSTEEFGDVLYQFVAFCKILDVNLEQLTEFENPPAKMFTYITKITSAYKKHVTRGKEINKVDIITYLSLIYTLIEKMCSELGVTMQDVEKENIIKLNRRYKLNG